MRAAGHKLCCTGIVGLECVNTFEIDSKVILKQVNSATLFSPSGNSLHLYRQEPQAVILDRTAFDISMAERAQRAGAEYRFNSRVIDAAIVNDHINVTMAYEGKEYQIPAQGDSYRQWLYPGIERAAGAREI